MMGFRRAPAKGARTVSLRGAAALGAGLALSAALTACGETTTRGYLLNESALEQVPVGSSQEQVLVVLGTPSTVATLNGEVFYYITTQTKRMAAFARPEVVDQRVLAIYFNKDRRVERIANYGVQDGKLFDFVTRTTPTVGADLSFLRQVFKGILGSGS